jgi:hypothetical protein
MHNNFDGGNHPGELELVHRDGRWWRSSVHRFLRLAATKAAGTSRDEPALRSQLDESQWNVDPFDVEAESRVSSAGTTLGRPLRHKKVGE